MYSESFCVQDQDFSLKTVAVQSIPVDSLVVYWSFITRLIQLTAYGRGCLLLGTFQLFLDILASCCRNYVVVLLLCSSFMFQLPVQLVYHICIIEVLCLLFCQNYIYIRCQLSVFISVVARLRVGLQPDFSVAGRLKGALKVKPTLHSEFKEMHSQHPRAFRLNRDFKFYTVV